MTDAIHVDRAVARRILAGDEKAFQELFDRFFPRLYRFALARLNGDRHTAEDIVQQTFCNAIERLDAYRGEAALYTWFCQICRNALADHYRRRGRGNERVVLLDRRRGITYDEAGVRAKWGVAPSSIPDWLALVGDSADKFGGECRCCDANWAVVRPSNGNLPVAISWKTMARLY